MRKKAWTENFTQKNKSAVLLADDFLFLFSISFSIFFLFFIWTIYQVYFQNFEERPHTHAESAEFVPKELSGEELGKINTYQGLINQNKEDREEFLRKEKELAEKIRQEEEREREEAEQKEKFARQTAKKNTQPKSRRVGVPGPILSPTGNSPWGRVCKKEYDSPKKSSKNPKGHIDSQCCLDPDEIPNSRCYYPPEIYGKLIEKYLNKK